MRKWCLTLVTILTTAPAPPADTVLLLYAANDGISSITFSPASNLMVGTFWNNQVCCWDVQANGQAIPKASMNYDKPVLCSAWSPDGTTVFSGAPVGRQVGLGGGRGAEGRVRDRRRELQGSCRGRLYQPVHLQFI